MEKGDNYSSGPCRECPEMRGQDGYSILARARKKLTVKEIMTRNVRVFAPDTSLADAILAMNQHGLDSVILVREGKRV
jgi:CBS domain-containing protein